MTIKKRLERLEAILDARGLDWDHPRVASDHFAGANKMVGEEPPKKWRRLADEFVQPGDWMNAKVNRQDVDPPDGGWIPAEPCYFGKRACTLSMYFARPVADEPAKDGPAEPEYREPVLPDDLGKWAEFSQDGINWMRYKLRGCHKESEASLTIWSEKNIGFRHCRIKKDA